MILAQERNVVHVAKMELFWNFSLTNGIYVRIMELYKEKGGYLDG